MTADNVATMVPRLDDPIAPTLENPAPQRSMEPTPWPPSDDGRPTMQQPGPTTTSTRKTAVLVGLAFLTATFAFAIGNALIHSYFSSATSHGALIAGVFLLGVDGVAVVAIGVNFLTSQTRWDAYVLPVYAVSGAAGLVLSSALLTSRIVPRNLSLLGVIGYPVFLVGSILAMFSAIDVTHGAGTLALVPGGLFELILPIWLFTKGFTSRQIEPR